MFCQVFLYDIRVLKVGGKRWVETLVIDIPVGDEVIIFTQKETRTVFPDPSGEKVLHYLVETYIRGHHSDDTVVIIRDSHGCCDACLAERIDVGLQPYYAVRVRGGLYIPGALRVGIIRGIIIFSRVLIQYSAGRPDIQIVDHRVMTHDGTEQRLDIGDALQLTR